ncbi:MAG: DUF3256 family protein [Bacteroides pyogenes]|nr:DUF3256 family protein [Bacteroides pyogenes]MCI7070221.1 DUF3256 family protein [Bacteroides pyogenes]
MRINMERKLSLSFILSVALGFFFLTPLRAQEAKTLFVNMPDSLLPLLTSVNRADCIDFLESKMKAEVDNRFGGKSEMTELGKDYICMQLSAQTSWQMKVLPVNDSVRVICTVSTACAPACDSTVRFYTSDWKSLPASSFIVLPAMDDFFNRPDSLQSQLFETSRRSADIPLMKVLLNKENTELTVQPVFDYMVKETAEKLKPFLRRPIVYEWKDGSFQKKTVLL